MDATVAFERFLAGWRCIVGHLSGGAETTIDGHAAFRYDPPLGARRISGEVVAFGGDPGEIAAGIQRAGLGPTPAITLWTAAPEADLASLEAAGFRLGATEYLMARPLDDRDGVGRLDAQRDAVRRVGSMAEGERVNGYQGRAAVHPGHLRDGRFAHYFMERDGTVACSAATIRVDERTSYLTNMFTDPNRRRQGLAATMLAHIHGEAARAGAAWSVLTSSEMGHPLYRSMGYEDLGTVLVVLRGEAAVTGVAAEAG